MSSRSEVPCWGAEAGTLYALTGTEGYSAPVVLDFDVYDETDWSTLGLDLSTRLGL